MEKQQDSQSPARRAPTSPSNREPLRVLLVAVPPVRPLGVIGPAEVFSDATRLRGGPPSYSVEIVTSGETAAVKTLTP